MHRASIMFIILLLTVFSGCSSGKTALETTGTIEAEEVRVITETGGTLEEIKVSEGDRVQKGTVIARLDSAALETELKQARAKLQAARARLEEVKAGARTGEIEAAREELKGLQAGVEAAEANHNFQQNLLEKYRQLARDGAITEQELDKQENRAAQAEQQLNQARASLQAAKNRLGLLTSGARKEVIKKAAASVDSARAMVELAETKLSRTVLHAPARGTVMTANFKKGEVVKPGAEIATLADTRSLYIYTYVPESRLNKVEPGQDVQVSVDSYPGKTFAGEVSYISPEAEFTPKNVQTKEDRVRLVFKVKVDIKSGKGKLWPGMPADVKFTG